MKFKKTDSESVMRDFGPLYNETKKPQLLFLVYNPKSFFLKERRRLKRKGLFERPFKAKVF